MRPGLCGVSEHDCSRYILCRRGLRRENASMGSAELISLLGIAGTLLGSFGGIGLGFLIERARWRREDRTRFHSDRYKSYTAFIENAEKLTLIPNGEEGEAGSVFFAAFAQIQLLGTTEVREAAQNIMGALGHARHEGENPIERMGKLNSPIEAFVVAARKELDIPADDGSLTALNKPTDGSEGQ